jgi:hypothetical protein
MTCVQLVLTTAETELAARVLEQASRNPELPATISDRMADLASLFRDTTDEPGRYPVTRL